MKIEICIPAYNEAPFIAAAIEGVREALAACGMAWSITVADNSSTDGTAGAAEALGYAEVRVLRVPARGKGAAVVAAARHTSADFFGFIDADLSAEPRCIYDLLAEIEAGADIAIGSRLHPQTKTNRSASRTFSSKLFNIIRRLILDMPFFDTQCGLKLANRRGIEELAQCKETGWFFDMEWLARARRAGLRVAEVPIIWDEEHFEGRQSKLRLMRDGFGALAAMLRIRRRVV